jgi:crotonobetainyl-CoA:carnitine CoA-transferase CaiB-like acyl-CoA transferase
VGRREPLEGLRVVDLSTLVAGPEASRYLADFGADVVKVEPPRGDSARSLGLSRDDDADSYFWKLLGRNKRSIVADLKSPAGLERVRRLARRADVLVENFRPGKLEALGLSPASLLEANERLVILRVSGFGQDGPYASRPGFATLAEAMSGFASISGEPDGAPLLPPTALTDEITGLVGAFAVMVALWERHASGMGQVIDVSLLESIVQLMGPLLMAYTDRGYLQPRLGSGIPYSVPRGTYRTADGRWVAVSASAEPVARRVLTLLGVADDPRFADHRSRMEHRDVVDGLVADWISARDHGEVLDEFRRIDAAAALVYTVADLVDDPHVVGRGVLTNVDGFLMQGLVARFSRTPGRVRSAGPALGAHDADFDDWEPDAGDTSAEEPADR